MRTAVVGTKPISASGSPVNDTGAQFPTVVSQVGCPRSNHAQIKATPAPIAAGSHASDLNDEGVRADAVRSVVSRALSTGEAMSAMSSTKGDTVREVYHCLDNFRYREVEWMAVGSALKRRAERALAQKISFRRSERISVANTASAKQRIRNSARKAKFNRLHRSRSRTAVKKTRLAIMSKDLEQAKVELIKAISYLDRAAGKGVIHKNNAARRKSRLMRQYNKAVAAATKR
jgi:SSU ribosomal protein S20P